MVASSRTSEAWRLVSDEGSCLDGHDFAPCPLSFLSTGMVSSYLEEIMALAERRGVAIRNIRLVQDSFYTMKGSALAGTMTGGAKDVELDAQDEADANAETLRALAHDAVAASPLSGLMRGVKESLFTLSHNGREIDPAKARRVEGPALPDPAGLLEAARPASGDWSGLVFRTGRETPLNENTRTFAGGSIAEHQDRLLHVRVFATLREDGVKEITQYLYNPHGTVFRFLSNEAGRAPDAASYIPAGIGFCFMMQFGRYAKIVGKPLKDYRILQDAHFTLGGASGGTGRAGGAEPLGTHRHLWSEQDDDCARTALDMAEQTCFLHALCRTDLNARIRVSPFDASLAA